ncbi:MAG: MBL fold metallo-hydrolase [Dehalococcoidales bacterium]|jgi:cyclase
MEKITNNVYMGNTFRGCNSSFVVTSAGVVVIDTPMVPAEAKQWRQEIEKHGEIKYVINGEPHNDHVAGNCWMGGTLVAQEGTRTVIRQNRKEDLEGQMKWMAPDAVPLPKEFHFRLPDITFSHNLTIYLGEHTFQLMHMPGHTPSEVAVYVPEEKVLFTSDNVIMGMPIMISAVPDAWLESLKKLQKLDVNKVIPGHGPAMDKSALQTMYDSVAYCTTELKTAVARGWSLQEVQEKVTFAEKWPLMPGDPMKSMRYECLAYMYGQLSKK